MTSQRRQKVALFLAEAWRALLQLYPRGIRLFWVAPLIPALVVVPEFLQHAAEVKLGMFESKEAFKAHQMDPLRWTFAYAKIAGLWLAILAAARVTASEERGGRWWDVREISWKPLLFGLILFGGLGSLPALWDGQLPREVDLGLQIVVGIATLPGLLLILAGLFGDPMPSPRDLFVRGWPWIARLSARST